MTTLVDLDRLSATDLYERAGARRMQELRLAEERIAGNAEQLDWFALRAWLPRAHADKFIGVPDKPTLGAYTKTVVRP